MAMIDGLVARLANEILGLDVPTPLPRMTYDEAMRRFGHDAPDLRFRHGTGRLHRSGGRNASFACSVTWRQNGGFVRGIRRPQAAERFSRKRIDELTDYVKTDFGGKGPGLVSCR